MRFRPTTIFTGQRFQVPQGIQRIDTRSTHGWQVRYNGTRFFSDSSCHGQAGASLILSAEELIARISRGMAPVSLQAAPSANKVSGLPPGISGPIVRSRVGSNTMVAELSVLLPQWSRPPVRRTVYIGSEKTYSIARYKKALIKARKLRQDAEKLYRAEATQARRQDIAVLREFIASLRAA